jgi:outer membrane protein OmpA-like peptidoglycan-associated protein
MVEKTGDSSFTLHLAGYIFKCALAAVLAASAMPSLHAQAVGGEGAGTVQLAREHRDAYSMVERSDWSRYDNGIYSGHLYREVRASLVPSPGAEGLVYQGNFFVLEETLRDLRQSARGLDAVIPVRFELSRDGALQIEDDQGFPSLRGFPAFPLEAVRPGSRWTARGSRVVDPLNEGFPVATPLVAEYEYQGIELYRDVPVHRITAQYAARYEGGAYPSPGRAAGLSGDAGKGPFRRLQGSHKVDILLKAADGLPLLMRDNLDETYFWADGSTLRFRGFTLTFGEGIVPLDRDALIRSLRHTISPGSPPGTPSGAVPGRPAGSPPGASAKTPPEGPPRTNPAVREDVPPVPALAGADLGIDMNPVPEGVRLTIRDIRFAPDSADFLPEERSRLDRIAQALRDIPGRSFLVEGHTAAVGRPGGEMELSLDRARRMIDELVKRGIPAERFMYKGWGGEKPLGDNATEDGRRLNRRVEITILE